MDFKKSFISLFACILVVLSTTTIVLSAETTATQEADTYLDDFEESGDLDDFEDSEDTDDFQTTEGQVLSQNEPAESDAPEKESIYNLKGDFTVSIIDNIAHEKPPAGQTDWRGLSSLKSELFLELDVDLPASWKFKISGSGFYDSAFSINDRSDYTDEVLNDDELGGELRKAFLSGSITDNIDIKTGRQIVVWGKSDNIRVTDVLNPVNIKTPGMTDLEDIRLPVFMTKIDYYSGPWNLSGIAVHEKRFNKIPSFGSDYYFYPLDIPENEPSDNFENMEFAVSLNGTFTGWDASLYYADFYDKTPYFSILDPMLAQFELLYSHQTMVGADINIALGNFLLKSEVAYFKSVDFSDYISGFTPVFVQQPYSKTKTLGGVEYTGFTDTTMSLEIMNNHVKEFDSTAKAAQINRNSWETAIRINRDFFNEKLSATFLALLYGKSFDEGSIYRAYCDYDLTDNFTITGGAVFYDGSEMVLLNNYQDNDRIYTHFEYSF